MWIVCQGNFNAYFLRFFFFFFVDLECRPLQILLGALRVKIPIATLIWSTEAALSPSPRDPSDQVWPFSQAIKF